jgi:co-chaperonin GroES (HSP10)
MINMTRDNLLIAEVAKEKKDNLSEGGIILKAETVSNKSAPQGLVIAVGPDVQYIKPNDVVWCNWANGVPVDVLDQQAVILPLEAVLGVQG